MPVDLRMVSPDELRGISEALRAAGDGKAVRKGLIKSLRGPVNKAKKDVQSTVKSLPVSAHATWSKSYSGAFSRAAYDVYRSTKSMSSQQLALSRAYGDGVKRARRSAGRSGLRASIARATATSVRLSGRRAGLQVRIRGEVLPPDQRTLPYHLDQPGGWRHPLFGDRSHWVQQKGKPYFEVTLVSHEKEYATAIRQVVDMWSAQIVGGQKIST